MKKRGDYFGNRKAQIAMFMIFAVLIMLLGVLYFYYQKNVALGNHEAVPQEIIPVKTFVDDCLKKVSEEGLQRIGMTGGYINIPKNIANDPRAYLPVASFKRPYWRYSGIQSVPPEDFIKKELSGYVKSELKSCLGDFAPFSQQFSISPSKEPIVDVQLNDADTSFDVAYPLEITSSIGSFRGNAQHFVYNSPVKFKKVYELAKLIMERENKDYFLEEKTIDLYSMDSNIPTTDIEAGCREKTWRLSSIKSELQALLAANIPYIRIQGTDYDPEIYVPNPDGKQTYSDSYFQQHYVWQLDSDSKKKYENMKVSFAYDSWPLQIYARPSENGILKSDSQNGADLLKFFCLHIWHFTYDISYPVVASIYDRPSEGISYQFSFAFKADIGHNQPNRLGSGTATFDSVGEPSSDDYCNDVQNEVTIFTVNNATGEDMKGVNLTFTCGRYSCSIGQTDWVGLGAAAGITKQLPYCVNAVLRGEKDGFAESKSFMQTDVDGRSYIMLMQPIKEFKNYKIMKHQLANPAIAEELAPNEKASIFIRSNQTGYEASAFLPQEADFPLKLPVGRDIEYEVTIFITDDDNIIGGYSGSWKVGRDDLANANSIVFHAIAQNTATSDERLLFVSGIGAYSKNVPQPEIK